MKISIISPVHNEEENIMNLCSEIAQAMKEFKSFELILVDDGSTDSSWNMIKSAKKNFNFVKGVRLSRNYGQTQAIAAGVTDATGEYIVIIDADLQNDPKDIPMMFREIEKGFDVVSGWRKNRKDEFFTRVLPSKIANAIISTVTKIKLHDYGCSLKIYRSEVLKEIEFYGEIHRFIPAIAGYKGARICEVEVNHRPRVAGKSKYGIFRIFKVLSDIIAVKFIGDFLTKPLYFFSAFSLVLFFLSSVCALITLYHKWYNHIFIKDQPLFLVAIFLALVAVQIGLIGLVAEMILRVYLVSSGKPVYKIKERA